jgi:hypothetical protein
LSVAKSFLSTSGFGQMSHIEVKLLWLEEIVQKSRVRVSKVCGATNVADVITKYHSLDTLCKILAQHGVVQAASTGSRVRPRGGLRIQPHPTP